MWTAGTFPNQVMHFDGTRWTDLTPAANDQLLTIWGTGPNNMFLGGKYGNVFHSTTLGVWNQLPVTGALHTNISRISGLPDGGSVFAVSHDYQRIYQWNGSDLTKVSENDAGRDTTLWDVWATAANDVWAVGAEGVVLHSDGTGWSAVDAGITFAGSPPTFYAVWASGPTDVLMAGYDSSQNTGVLLHLTGNGWFMDPYLDQPLYTLWGTSKFDVWMGGQGGGLAHYDGNVWTPVIPGAPGFNIYQLGGSGTEGVWGAGPVFDSNNSHSFVRRYLR